MIMINKTKTRSAYFLNSNWAQLIIKCPTHKAGDFLSEFSIFLENLKEKKKIRSWFLLNKNNKILFKIEFSRKNKNNSLLFDKIIIKNPKVNFLLATFEPEIYQFGGKLGWALAKEYLNSVSLIISKLKIDYSQKKIVALTIMFDLFLRACGDSWEAWDALQRLMIVRGIKKLDFPILPSVLNSELFKYSSRLINNPQKEYFDKTKKNLLLADFALVNQDLSRKLKVNELFLNFSIRKILPYYIVFVFNMLLIEEIDQIEIIRSLALNLNPAKY